MFKYDGGTCRRELLFIGFIELVLFKSRPDDLGISTNVLSFCPSSRTFQGEFISGRMTTRPTDEKS